VLGSTSILPVNRHAPSLRLITEDQKLQLLQTCLDCAVRRRCQTLAILQYLSFFLVAVLSEKVIQPSRTVRQAGLRLCESESSLLGVHGGHKHASAAFVCFCTAVLHCFHQLVSCPVTEMS